MLHLNEIQRHEPKHRGKRAIQEEGQEIGQRERSRPEQTDRKHRPSHPPFDDDERDERHHSTAHDCEQQQAVGARERPLEEPEDDASEANDGQACTHPIDARRSRRVAAFGHESRRQRDDDRGQRHVQHKYGAPADVLNQPSPRDWSDGRHHGAESGPCADRPAAIGVVKGGADNRETPRHQERGADALRRTCRDERARGACEAARHRRDGKQDRASEKRPLSAELVAHGAADENQPTQEQRVRFDHPLDVGDGRMQVRLKSGQSHVDHRRVDERHARADDRGYKRPPRLKTQSWRRTASRAAPWR